MATVTPNFNWPVPTSTDLVKDGATAIEALGDSIDASLVDLKGGTTGQVLSKNSNTDMDFVWVTDAAGDITGVTAGTGISGGGTSGTVTVTNSMATAIDAKGDLIAGTAADTFARVAVGTNGQVLAADSTAAAGLAWAAPGGMTLLSTTTLSGASTTISSISSAYKDLRIIIGGVSNSTADGNFTIKHNGYSDSQYITYNDNSTFTTQQNGFYSTGSVVTRTDSNNVWDFTIGNYASTAFNFKSVNGRFVYVAPPGAVKDGNVGGGWFAGGVAISSLTFANTGGNFAGGTVLLYGVN